MLELVHMPPKILTVDQITRRDRKRLDNNEVRLRREPYDRLTGGKIAKQLIMSLPAKYRRNLDSSWQDHPYIVHAAQAAIDADLFDLHHKYRRLFENGEVVFSCPLDHPGVKIPRAIYGPDKTKQCMLWIAREQYARAVGYGQRQGIYWSSAFIYLLTHFRERFKSRYQPPEHAAQITALLMQADVLKLSGYIRGTQHKWPAYLLGK